MAAVSVAEADQMAAVSAAAKATHAVSTLAGLVLRDRLFLLLITY